MNNYTIFNTVDEIVRFRNQFDATFSIGFVPTMGALHEGHCSLIKQSVSENKLTICSIFVNPIQFNDKNDFEKYPRQISDDIKLALDAGCSHFFIPTVAEMFPFEDKTDYNFGLLDQVMEGAFRPGHFRGVAVVVRRLFEIIKPTKAYFGLKDYQQLKVIESLVKQFKLSPEIVPCKIIREENGLAMSSRNQRLTAKQRQEASIIYKTLSKIAAHHANETKNEMQEIMIESISAFDYMQLEYFELANSETLEPINQLQPKQEAMAFVVVKVAGIRLIDNIKIIL